MSERMTFPVSIRDAYSWDSQAMQYPQVGSPGISYFAGATELGTVDCLLYRSPIGQLVGILNHYPIDFPMERAGNVNIWVREDWQRKGVGTALWRAARNRWDVNLDQQRYTASGAALAARLRERDMG